MSGRYVVLVVAGVLGCHSRSLRQDPVAEARKIGILGIGFNAEVSLAAGSPRRQALSSSLREVGLREGRAFHLERPGGNATGIIPRADTYSTRLELIRALVPGAGPVGYLFNPSSAPGVGTLEQTRKAASAVAIALDVVHANEVADFEPSFARFASDGVSRISSSGRGARPLT